MRHRLIGILGSRLSVRCLTAMSYLIVIGGCSAPNPDRVVMMHLVEPNEMAGGVMRVAQNEPIWVSIDKTQEYLQIDCAGLLLIPERDWVGMLRLLAMRDPNQPKDVR